MGQFVDLTKQVFERWTVQHRAPNKGKKVHWTCRCSCGAIKDVFAGSLTQGISKSCGCLRGELAALANTTHGMCARSEQLRAGQKQTLEYTMFRNAKGRAKRKCLPFTLLLSDITIPEYCPVLGIKLSRENHVGYASNSPSLDKLVPTLGYTKSNSRVISNRANSLKNNATLAELKALVKWMENTQCHSLV